MLVVICTLGGFRYVSCSSVLGKEKQFDKHIFQIASFNHQPCYHINHIFKNGHRKDMFPKQKRKSSSNHHFFLRGKLAVWTSWGSVTLPACTTKRAGLKNGALASATGRSNGARIIHIKVVDPWSCQTMACEWRFLEWFDHGSGQI